MKYKAIIFDFFGVIASDMYILWLNKNGLADRIPELIKTHFQYSDVGTLSPEDLHKHLASLVGRSVNAVEVELKDCMKLDRKVEQFIKSIWSDSLQIAICSNAPLGIVEKFIDDKGLGRYFNQIVISSALGTRKPDKTIFEKILELLDITPQEAVFIDDKEENIKSAEDLGIKSILFSDTSELREELLQK